MQFHLNGYRTGDPLVEERHPGAAEPSDGLPESVDVLIVGCGPVGLVLAAQLAGFPHIRRPRGRRLARLPLRRPLALPRRPKAGDIFDLRGIDRDSGCPVVVRPDQYVAHVLPLHAHDALAGFFAGFLIDAAATRGS